MTACVNKNHGRRVAGVVTASLVGALTLGGVSLAAVPTVALAEQGSLQAAWYTNTTVKSATDGTATVKDPANATFQVKSGKFLVPTVISNGFEDTDVTTKDYRLTYFKADGTKVSGTVDGKSVPAAFDNDGFNATTLENLKKIFASQPAGTYHVVVTKKGVDPVFTSGSSPEQSDSIYFKLVDSSVEGLYAYEGTDKSDKSFMYNGSNLQVGVADAKGNPQTIDSIHKVGSTADINGSVKDAGDYVAVVTVNGKSVNVPFTVKKLSLANAKVDDRVEGVNGWFSYDQGNLALLNAIDVDGTTLDASIVDAADNVSTPAKPVVMSVTQPDGTQGLPTANAPYGKYTVTLTAADGSANITEGKVTVEFYHTQYRDGSSAFYGNKKVGSTLSVNPADGEKFDASKLSMRYDDGRVLDPSAYEVSYKNHSGETVDASALAEVGDYTVTVRVKPYQDKSGAWYGNTVTFTVEVANSVKLDASKNLQFYLDGEAVDGNSKTVAYDGADASKALTAAVKDGNGTSLKEGTDFELVVKGEDGKEVESATDAGKYTVTVKPLTFKWLDDSKADFALTVDPRVLDNAKDLTSAEVRGTDASGNATYKLADDVVAYTGSAIATPGVTYQKVDRFNAPVVTKSGQVVYDSALSSDLYTVASLTYSKDGRESYKAVTELKEAGSYRVKVALTDKAASNYQLKDDTFEVRVVKLSPFADVESPSWYAKGVARAKSAGYVHGIAGTDLFSPNADITRADAAVILFNMAGGRGAHGNAEFSFDETGGYVTGFSDVDGHAYYAQAIAWAKAAGVATGDAGTTNFRPGDTITRQEFAALLYKYNQRTGAKPEAEGDSLSGMSDASTVDGWATKAVNWAVSQKVMGNGGYVAGQSNIVRAEVASMAVNYQPQK